MTWLRSSSQRSVNADPAECESQSLSQRSVSVYYLLHTMYIMLSNVDRVIRLAPTSHQGSPKYQQFAGKGPTNGKFCGFRELLEICCNLRSVLTSKIRQKSAALLPESSIPQNCWSFSMLPIARTMVSCLDTSHIWLSPQRITIEMKQVATDFIEMDTFAPFVPCIATVGGLT
jgi:hypothetical protein